ncbi:hypothetical protein M422DRAFT_251205 [Sphaerobolus stellatus SS14]|uniref:Uncharacterized protein n=1 Tax=Sphaerobolus stellatus (strain SS14) TaxID=990650 RepID=A0A0C9W1N4_SPHS4|nr:hypothetical protein M422DRAFT_251205 [Sphaerobolus stellatus SS14]
MSAQNQSCDGALKLSAPLPTDAIEPTAKTLCSTYTVQTNIVPSRTSYAAPYTSSVTPLTVFPFLSGFCSNHGYTFDAAYTLHSRGWPSGATSALSFCVSDFTITAQGGSTFRIEPQPGVSAIRLCTEHESCEH